MKLNFPNLKYADASNNKQKSILRCHRLAFNDLGTIFYATFAISLHLVSIMLTIKQIKFFMFTLMWDLSVKITETINYDKSANANMVSDHPNLSNSKYFVINQFWTPIAFVTFSFIFMVCFGICSYFKIGNVGNDNIQLGIDLVNTDSIKSKHDQEESVKGIKINSLINDGSFIAKSNSPLETSSSSLYSSFRSLTNLQMQSEKINIFQFNLLKLFCLPPVSTCFHLMMCFCLMIARLSLHKHKLGYDLTGEQAIPSEIINVNSTLGQMNQFVSCYINTVDNQLDLNYLNYFLGFMMLIYKTTRVYSNMNRLYAFLVFSHVVFFTLMNLTTLGAFEALFNSMRITRMSEIVKKTSGLSRLIRNLDLNHTIVNATSNKLLPGIFLNNEAFLMGFYIAGSLLNLIYLSCLNLFALTFYKNAQSIMRHKYECYLNNFVICSKPSTRRPTSMLSGFITKETGDSFNLDTIEKAATSLPHLNSIAYLGIQNQYKSVLAGIIVLLLTEFFRAPLIYAFYLKYVLENVDVYLAGLMFQLSYLLFNALFWILLSFKTNWTVKFSSNFRVLFWNRIYTEYFCSQNIGKSKLSHKSNSNEREVKMSQNNKVIKELDSSIESGFKQKYDLGLFDQVERNLAVNSINNLDELEIKVKLKDSKESMQPKCSTFGMSSFSKANPLNQTSKTHFKCANSGSEYLSPFRTELNFDKRNLINLMQQKINEHNNFSTIHF